jgi:hypothetical protein
MCWEFVIIIHKEVVVDYWRHSPDTGLGETAKTTRNLSQDKLQPCRHLNRLRAEQNVTAALTCSDNLYVDYMMKCYEQPPLGKPTERYSFGVYLFYLWFI